MQGEYSRLRMDELPDDGSPLYDGGKAHLVLVLKSGLLTVIHDNAFAFYQAAIDKGWAHSFPLPFVHAKAEAEWYVRRCAPILDRAMEYCRQTVDGRYSFSPSGQSALQMCGGLLMGSIQMIRYEDEEVRRRMNLMTPREVFDMAVADGFEPFCEHDSPIDHDEAAAIARSVATYIVMSDRYCKHVVEIPGSENFSECIRHWMSQPRVVVDGPKVFHC